MLVYVFFDEILEIFGGIEDEALFQKKLFSLSALLNQLKSAAEIFLLLLKKCRRTDTTFLFAL